MLTSLGTLYERGASIDWQGFERDYVRRKVALPTYPFQRQRYWVEARPTRPRSPSLRPLIDTMIRIPRRQELLFEKSFSVESMPFLAEHRVYGEVVVPGACHLSMILSGAELLYDGAACVVEDVVFPQALVLPPLQKRTVQLSVVAERSGAPSSLQVTSFASEDATTEPVPEHVHATGRLARLANTADTVDLPLLRTHCTNEITAASLYQRLAISEVALGTSFQWLSRVWQGRTGEALAQLRRPAKVADIQGYRIYPGLLDACLQLVVATDSKVLPHLTPGETLLPFSIDRLTCYRSADQEELWCYAVCEDVPLSHPASGTTARWNFTLCQADGELVAVLSGLQLRVVPAAAIQGEKLRTDWLYGLNWDHQPLSDLMRSPAKTVRDHEPWLLIGADSALEQEIRSTLMRIHADPPNLHVVDVATVATKLQTVAGTATPVTVIYWATVLAEATSAPEQALAQSTALLQLSQILSASARSVRLWIVTIDGQLPDGQMVATSGAAAVGGTLWGLGRALMQEAPELNCLLLDLSSRHTPAEQATILVEEMLTPRRDTQIAWRAERRYVAHLSPRRVTDAHPNSLHPEASYLITGGLGALGLYVAEQLAADGARRIVIASRSSVRNDHQQRVLHSLFEADVTVEVVPTDMSDPHAVALLLRQTLALGPLRGIVHAAGVVDDGTLAQQSPVRFATVLAPKAKGSWQLHEQTQGQDLDFFICFSSIASLIGAAGQSNYAAANGFMDGLMQARRAQGLPGLSVNWGPWADTGMAVAMRERMGRLGLGMIPPHQGRALFSLLRSSMHGQIGVLPLLQAVTPTTDLDPSADLYTDLLSRPLDERRVLLMTRLQQEVGRILSFADSRQVDPALPLLDLGLDSLMAVELRNWMLQTLGLPPPLSLLLDGGSTITLTDYALAQITSSPAVDEPSPLPTTLPTELVTDSIDEPTTEQYRRLDGEI